MPHASQRIRRPDLTIQYPNAVHTTIDSFSVVTWPTQVRDITAEEAHAMWIRGDIDLILDVRSPSEV